MPALAERAARATGRDCFPARYYLEVQRAGQPQRRRTPGRRSVGARRANSACRWWRRIRCSSSSRDDFQAHEARVCIAEGYVLGRPAPAARLHRRSSTSRRRPRWRSCSPTCPRRSRTRWRSPAAATCRVDAGQEPPAAVPDAARA
ncbi:MAG: hypothetical protein MZW92_60670 [Comamonadaceae bacterium]|nr:hypothetical protein [Comamonadaceae bacterium]